MKTPSKPQSDPRARARAQEVDRELGLAEGALRAAESPADRVAATWEPVDSLRGWERNPRTHGPVESLCRAIIRFGWGPPVVAVRQTREAIAGHKRLSACGRLRDLWALAGPGERARWHPDAVRVAVEGLVPVRFVDHDEATAHAMAVSDNREAEHSKWDHGLLLDVAAELEAVGIAPPAFGFEVDELDRMRDTRGSLEVEEVPTSDVADQFWLMVSGPLPSQPDVIEELRAVVAKLQERSGLVVEFGTTEIG